MTRWWHRKPKPAPGHPTLLNQLFYGDDNMLDGVVFRGVPEIDTTIRVGLPEVQWRSLSRWDVTWGKHPVYLNPTRWQRFKIKWRSRADRAREAWKVYTGELEARSWDDYD